MNPARHWRRIVVGAMVICFAATAQAGSYQQERMLGARFDMMAQAQMPLNRDPEILAYVEKIGQRIVAGLESSVFDYKFSVVRDPSINAFAVPGGYIYVHEGLILHADNDDEVASVMGHEVAHVNAHHMVRQQEKTQLINYASMLAMLAAVVRPELMALAQAGQQAASLKYTREFEQEADYLGARYMRAGGYDSRSMLDFFKKLEEKSRAHAGVPAFLQSHPLSGERLNHLEAVLRAQQWGKHERPPATFELVRIQALIRGRNGPPAAVLKDYGHLLDDQPDDPMHNYLYGVVALEVGRLGDAKATLTKARGAGLSVADRGLGRVALRSREADVAIALLSGYLEREPGDSGAWAKLAKAQEVSGDLEAARRNYRKAFELSPRFALAHRGYGLAGRAGDKGEGYFHLGVASQLDGDYSQALEHFQRALPLLPPEDPRSEQAKGAIRTLSVYAKGG